MTHLLHVRANRLGHQVVRGSAPSFAGLPAPMRGPMPVRRAPVALAAAVAVLGVVLLDVLAALAVLLAHPSLFAGLENRETPISTHAMPRGSTRSTARASSPPMVVEARSSLRFVGATPAMATYAVPRRRYTIAFFVNQPCWVALRVPPGAAVPTFSATLVPPRPTAITVTGAASVMVAARADAIAIRVGDHTIGTIEAPVVGLTYRFVPNLG